MPNPIPSKQVFANENRADSDSPRVLLVDDTPSNTLVAKAILKRCGSVDADTAENGLIALDLVKNNDYDVIFMDCMMPEMDGYEATRSIRSGEAGADKKCIPIIALTANAMQGDREACLDSGMSDFLTKPIDPEILVRSLKEWVGRTHC